MKKSLKKLVLLSSLISSCVTASSQPVSNEVKCYENLQTGKIIEVNADVVITADHIPVSCILNTGVFNCESTLDEVALMLYDFCQGGYRVYAEQNACEGYEQPAYIVVYRCSKGVR